MKYYKLKLTKNQIQELTDITDGYAWLALDIHRHTAVAGDEHYTELKRRLYQLRSRAKDIFGAGIDLISGEITFRSPINRKVFDLRSSSRVPEDKEAAVEQEIRYFLQHLFEVR
jgi:hypothetical protein